MLSLGRDGYTSTEVRDALLGDHREWRFAFEHLTDGNAPLGWLSGIEEAEIANNALATLKRSMKFRVSTVNDDTFDWAKDRIRPWAYLQMPGGGEASFPLGVFLPATPSVEVSGVSQYQTRSVEAFDQLLVLSDDVLDARLTVTTGTNYVTAVADTLTAAGVTQQLLVPTALTLPADREWPPGTSRLEVVNDLLNAINYGSLFFNAEGFAAAEPYVSPADALSEFTYITDDRSVILPDAEHELDLFSVPNKWILYVSQPDRPELIATYTNTNPDSPTSTVARGRTITDFREEQAEGEEAVDQTTLDAKVARLAESASQVYSSVEFSTLIMPIHEDADVFRIEFPELGVSEKYSEHTWTLPLAAGGEMKHRVRKVVVLS